MPGTTVEVEGAPVGRSTSPSTPPSVRYRFLPGAEREVMSTMQTTRPSVMDLAEEVRVGPSGIPEPRFPEAPAPT